MAITSDNMTQLTARCGLARSGASRMYAAPRVDHLEPVTGRIVFHRDTDKDGDPIYSTATWTTGREG